MTETKTEQENPADEPGFLCPALDIVAPEPYITAMDDVTDSGRKRRFSWGTVFSAMLHAAFVALLVFNLPLPTFEPPKEETVTVEMVPPPEEKKPEPQPEQKPEEPKPPEEQAQPKAPRAPSATMLAVPPPAGRDIPESDRFTGSSRTDEPDAQVETAPKPDVAAETAPQVQPLPGVETATDPQEKEAAGTAEQPPAQEPARTEAPPILAARDSGDVPAPDNPPVPLPKPVAGKGDGEVLPGQGVKDAKPLKPANVLSNARLHDPMQRMALGQLPLRRRIVQLCTYEMLAQIVATRPGTALHGMVPFSDHGGKIAANTLDATGGAYRTMAGDWYDVTFHCKVDPDAMEVLSFSFRLGDATVTRAQRLSRGLPAE